MINQKSILFIINPIAGTKNKTSLEHQIRTLLKEEKFSLEIKHTEHRGHGAEIAREAARNQVDIVVAAGGDGTINEIASQLVGTTTALGIIPLGSGNGLARSLDIPMDTSEAIRRLNDLRSRRIDAGKMNEHYFFCTAGIGFDAYIAKRFEFANGRGLQTYVKESIQEYSHYLPLTYSIKIAEKQFNQKAFILTFANAGQYGNNAYVSPEADMNDGLLDMCILQPFNNLEGIRIASDVFTKNIHRNKKMSIQHIKEATVSCESLDCYHVDGDYKPLKEGKIEVSILPQVLQVMV